MPGALPFEAADAPGKMKILICSIHRKGFVVQYISKNVHFGLPYVKLCTHEREEAYAPVTDLSL